MGKILTIVIPSFNVEKFLSKTLESFIYPSILEDIEVLVVDDGSKDCTADIARAYVERYPQTFKLIQKKNGGHGSTINRGIQEANGKFFKVVDGDDWVDTQELSKLVESLRNCNCDYVVTNYTEVNDDNGDEEVILFHSFNYQKEYQFEDIASVQLPMHSLTIRTEILKDNHIKLDEHMFYVDVEYILYPIPYVNSVLFLDYNVYMYRVAQTTQSVSMQGFQKHIQNHLDVIYNLISFLNQYSISGGENIKVDYIARRIAKMVGTQCAIYASYPSNDKEIKREFHVFDTTLRQQNRLVYTYSSLGRLKLLRFTRFHFYRMIMTVSNQYHKE